MTGWLMSSDRFSGPVLTFEFRFTSSLGHALPIAIVAKAMFRTPARL
jgi:hypothetical protein